MKKLKSSLTNMLVVLTVITIVAAGVLASVNAVTAPQIEKINEENLAAGIKAVMGSDDIQVSEPWEVDNFTAYDINDKDGNLLGKAVVTVENGFGGPLKVLVGFNVDGDILGYTVLEHAETPGLGAKAGEWFQDKIIGMNPGKNKFTVSKDGGEVDAITASTITSRAFLRAIQNAYDKIIIGLDVNSGASQQASASSMGKPEAIE
ncbi:MAG: RnfABCDGE type electron transport complex subunit G [Bacteroidaceae bacterium]|jgi:electron transport complex protein RnfG|nr:RnfABCDGE type electron transport complex subunit G [Bacteroidaceae bacterium]MBR3618338.1 RnfABCDGE type electron transport complex subunit G [Bacteroidaceae bacterium]